MRPYEGTGVVVGDAGVLAAAARAHALAHSPAAAPDTAVYYTNTVNWLRDTHPAYTKRMSE